MSEDQESRFFLSCRGESVHLPVGVTTVGRDLSCSVRFTDTAMSRKHFQIEVNDAGRAVIEDLHSTNGTVVNSHRLVAPREIHHGDQIEVGVLKFDFEEHDPDGFDETTDVDLLPRDEAVVEWMRQSHTQQLPLENALRLHMGTDGNAKADRRRHKRFEVDIPVVYSSDTLELETTAVNVSISGIFITSAYLEPLGTSCNVALEVNGAGAHQIDGRVVRVIERGHATIPPGLGIEFDFPGKQFPGWWTSLLTRLRA